MSNLIQLFNEKTNGGLLFWEDEFSTEKLKKTAKGFSFNNGSCNVTKTTNGNYVYTNFKEFDKGISVLEYVQKRDFTDVKGALKTILNQFSLSGSYVPAPAFLPIKKWEDTTEASNYYNVVYLDEPINLDLVAPYLTKGIAKEYNFFQVKEYSVVRNVNAGSKLSLLTVSATENYPIFAYKYAGFVKIYEPKAVKDKNGFSSKHHFLGTKPQTPIHGIQRLNVPTKEKQNNDFVIQDLTTGEEEEKYKLEYIFIATGGSDGLNLASFGYDVIWFNSETEIISEYDLNQLFKIAKNVVYVPDLDTTGIEQAVRMGFMSETHLKIKMLFLPKELKERNKKDIKDWVFLHKTEKLTSLIYQFNRLLSQALEFEFWYFNKKRGVYQINNIRLVNFLHYLGYYIYDIPQMDKKNARAITESIFIKIENNVITKITKEDIKRHVLNWLESRLYPRYVQEILIRSTFFGDTQGIRLIPKTEINTTKTSSTNQLFFYNNIIVNITKNGVEEIKYNNNNTQVWKNNIIDRRFQKREQAVKIIKNENGNFDIEILNNSSKYLRLLINTSRFYWLKDADAEQNDLNPFSITSSKLTDIENSHQKQELIIKMYCLGYLLHEHKIKPKSYIVIGTDNAIGKTSKANKGGSGKSAIISGLYSLIPNYVERNGRDLNKETERFRYTEVDSETRLLHFDEMNPYFDIPKLFTDITGDVTCNWKGGKFVYVPFKYFTKLAISMNSVPKEINEESMNRRSLNFETSSFYHEKNEDYLFTRKVSDSFNGITLWDEKYELEDWILDDNFLFECLQFYLGTDKKPDVSSVNLIYKSTRMRLGDGLFSLFEEFFEELINPNADTEAIEHISYIEKSTGILWINSSLLYEMQKTNLEKKAKNRVDFTHDLEDFCKNILNKPIKEFRKKKESGVFKTVQHFCFCPEDIVDVKAEVLDSTDLLF